MTSHLLEGAVPYWSAPLETLASRQGDCKDYPIAKYVALREVSLSDVRLIIVGDLASGADHGVVVARFHGRWIISTTARLALHADFEMPRAISLFEFDQDDGEQFRSTTTASVQPQSARASVQ